jgi:hypothetical protein
MDPQIEKNPSLALKRYRTAGPTPTTERGSRATVIGTISPECALLETFRFMRSGNCGDGYYKNELQSDWYERWLVESIPVFKKYANGRF